MLPDFELCCSEFARYDIELNKTQYEKFDIYADFLVEYNKNVNLTAITEPHEILLKHFIDSVLTIKRVNINDSAALIDVGTGAGFPSIPIKIMRPDIKLTLLDSLAKRVSFLEQLCDKISIDAECIHGRAEDVAKMPDYREKFDFSCARAVANMSVLAEYCLPFLKVDGKFFALKGPSEDISKSDNALNILGGQIALIHDYFLENERRRIIEIKKISHTPTKYPRNSSQIKKKAL